MLIKTRLRIAVVIGVLSVSFVAHAQSDIALATRTAKLQALSENLRIRDQQDRQQALEFAGRAGIPVRRELPNGKVLELQRIAPGIGPIFYITYNVDAADTVSTDEVWPGGSAGLDLDGSGMTVGEWDGGAVYPAHGDFTGRLSQVDGATIVSNHSTHVAGTLIGSGEWLTADSRGMAYAAHLDAYDWNSDTAEMATAASLGLLVSNHSYGIAAGWLYTGIPSPPDTWLWIGGEDPSIVEDSNFGYYDSETQLWDQIAYDAPYYLIVKAASNDRSDIGPSPGEEYTIIDQDGEPVGTSTVPRLPDCAPDGYDCLPTTSVAKNVLTVGAVDDLIGGYSVFSGPSAVQMADFSGWGPTDDGRIKPDVVGNGMFLLSAWGDYPYYAAAAGTSMSAPNVTGSLLLLQEHYQDVNGPGNFMRAATLKALAIHTADETGDADGPDYEFGWGLLNTKSAAQVISDDGSAHQIIEGSLANGATDVLEVSVTDPDVIVKATLVWADPPGTPVAPSLDPPDLMLVNDLDLRVQYGVATHLPWVLNPSSPAVAATTGDNFRDNVEQVVVPGGPGSYFINVSHKGTLHNFDDQDYSLVISVKPPPPVGSALLIDEDFSGGLPPGWSVQTVRGISWTINTPVSGNSRLDNWTGGTGKFAMVNNNYNNITLTNLRSPTFDLSSTTAVVLRFKSYFYMDTFESINVDTSNNGGASWTNVWTWQGFNPFPTLYTLDLSGIAAGQPSVSLRFRYDSLGDKQGDLWQIDDVELQAFGDTPSPDDPPGQVTSPDPVNGSSAVGINTDLSWTAGALVTSQDLYFGTTSSLGAPNLQGHPESTTFDLGTLAYSTAYYWRVDQVNAQGTTTGSTWSFTTEAAPPVPPSQATNPNPADGSAGLGLNPSLLWTAGSLATSHDVYFGTASTLGASDLQRNQLGTTFIPGSLVNSTTYYWRIDEVNGYGSTPGNTWSFTTETAPPPPPPAQTINLAGLIGSSIPDSRGRWTAQVEIEVEDQGDSPAPGATVEGIWSNGATGGASCVTTSSGRCSVAKSNLKGNVSSVRFTVNNLTKAGWSYNPSDNLGGSSITVSQSSVNQTPSAVNDSYQTDVDVPVNGNVITNDNPGDGPASINSNTLPAKGILSLAGNGAFTYTPNATYEGSDSFTYSIIDQDGDISNTATVSITVSGTPPPPPPGGLSVSLRPFKVKGLQQVEVLWSGFVGETVTISRNGTALDGSPFANSGLLVDNIGVKGSGQTYLYEVCETGTSNCASETTGF